MKFRNFIESYGLGCFVAGAVVVVVIFTAISVSFYVSSGAINVDCSLPTDAEVCAKINNDDVNEKMFSPTGDFDKGTIYDFNMIFDEIMSEIDGMNSFSMDAVSDAALNLE